MLFYEQASREIMLAANKSRRGVPTGVDAMLEVPRNIE
jgi:hypothetical protein